MKIIQVNTSDSGGGAERIVWALFKGFQENGHQTRLVVSEKRSNDALVIDPFKRPEQSIVGKLLLNLLNRVKPLDDPNAGQNRIHYTNLKRGLKRLLGIEIFDYPKTYRLYELAGFQPDILNFHNLHRHDGSFFDLRALPWFSHRVPVVLSLHDAWLLSGHCAHSMECQRWKTGCGHCPDLTIYPPQRRDATAYNWKVKRRIYQQSRLHIVTPCHWLMEKVEQSILKPALVRGSVIPNGIDLGIFHPENKSLVRKKLALPQKTPVLLFTASGIRNNPFKDFDTLRQAFERIALQLESTPPIFLALGEKAEPIQIGASQIRFIPYLADPTQVAEYYQAADIYVHAARVDTFPVTILEALTCGAPVVATAVGGISEQVLDGKTGFLTPAGNPASLAERVVQLIHQPELRNALGEQAAQDAGRRFNQQRMIQDYLNLFHEISPAI